MIERGNQQTLIVVTFLTFFYGPSMIFGCLSKLYLSTGVLSYGPFLIFTIMVMIYKMLTEKLANISVKYNHSYYAISPLKKGLPELVVCNISILSVQEVLTHFI